MQDDSKGVYTSRCWFKMISPFDISSVCVAFEWLNMCLYIYIYMRYMIDTFIYDGNEIYNRYLHLWWGRQWDTIAWIWAHKFFEESEIHIGSGNQRIESSDFENHWVVSMVFI